MKKSCFLLVLIFLTGLMSLSFSSGEEKYFCPSYEFHINILNDNNNQVSSFLINGTANTAVTNNTTKFWSGYVNSSCSGSGVFRFEKNKTYIISRANSKNCVCIKFLNNYTLRTLAKIKYNEASKEFSIENAGQYCDIQVNNKISKLCYCSKKMDTNVVSGSKDGARTKKQ